MKLNTNLLADDKDLKHPDNIFNITEKYKPKVLCYVNSKWYLSLSDKATVRMGTITEVTPNIIRIDLNTGNIFAFVVTKNIKLEITNDDLTNFNHGYQVIIRIKNGGNFVVTYPTNFKFVNGKVPTLTKNGNDELNCLVLPNNSVHVNVLLDIK